MDVEVISKIQKLGFSVYMRKLSDSWLVYEQDDKIAYMQEEIMNSFSISTIHIPNRNSGTGFLVEKYIEKYRNIQHYINRSPFNREYSLIEDKGVPHGH